MAAGKDNPGTVRPAPSASQGLTVLFAGGGSGGHVFPNLAIIERLREAGAKFSPRLVLSNRPLDAQIAQQNSLPAVILPVRPVTLRPWHWPAFLGAWLRSRKAVSEVLRTSRVAAVVATGGFVSGPPIAAAKALGIPSALVNLDAVPGRANRLLAKKASVLFTAYDVPHWPSAARIGMPVRRAAIGPENSAEARRELGLDGSRPLLLICGGSQGAASINRMIPALLANPELRPILATWQVLHLCGQGAEASLTAAYSQARVQARVQAFSDRMDLAWSGADVAISRAGANSVAEAWANTTPTIFLPYPYHKDEHQRLNAQPLVDLGGAVIYRDLIEPQANAQQLAGPLISLLGNAEWRKRMVDQMRQHPLTDGAQVVADWVAQQLKC